MALPPLPEVFGNYAIRGIEEILPPDAISWLPTTTGWKILLLVLAAWMARAVWRRWQHWQRNRYRGEALRQLQQLLDEDLPAGTRLGRVAALLKATALQAYPRRTVAALSGNSWLVWLNSCSEQAIFSERSRDLLQESVYQANPELDGAAITTLFRESASWIRLHREFADA